MYTKLNPAKEENDLDSKLAAALDRLSQAMRTLLWQPAKALSLSPVQVQMLIYLMQHQGNRCTITSISHVFSLSKATVSDSVKVLVQKALVRRIALGYDLRTAALELTDKGFDLANTATSFITPLLESLQLISSQQKEVAYNTLLEMIHYLHATGIIRVQRICYSCYFHSLQEGDSFCGLLQQKLDAASKQLDCADWQQIHSS